MGATSRMTEAAYLSRDNQIVLQLKKDGTIQSTSALTRIRLIFTSTLQLDYDEDNNFFDWTTVDGEIAVVLGQSHIPEGSYNNVRLIIYDSTHTNGVDWGGLNIIVRGACIE